MSKPRYVTHETCPECPEGEVWINSNLTQPERDEVLVELGMDNSIVYQSEAKVEREPSADNERRSMLTRLVDELAQPPEEPRRTIVNVSAPVVRNEMPDFPVRELAEALAEMQAEVIQPLVEALTRQADAMGKLAEAIAAQKPARVEVYPAPSNPTPLNLHLPVEEKKRKKKKIKFVLDDRGDPIGAEEEDESEAAS